MRIALKSITPFRMNHGTRNESRRSVRAYAKQMQAGVRFPPIVVVKHAAHCYELFDGMHRARAARLAGRQMIEVSLMLDLSQEAEP